MYLSIIFLLSFYNQSEIDLFTSAAQRSEIREVKNNADVEDDDALIAIGVSKGVFNVATSVNVALRNDTTLKPLEMTWRILTADRTKRVMDIEVTLYNATSLTLKGGFWSLEWNQLGGRIDTESLPSGIQAERVSGDWHRMAFGKEGGVLRPGDTLTFTMKLNGFIERESYGPVGVFLYDEETGAHQDVSMSLDLRGLKSVEGLELPTLTSRFESYAPGTILGKDALHWVIPTPTSVKLLAGRKYGEWTVPNVASPAKQSTVASNVPDPDKSRIDGVGTTRTFDSDLSLFEAELKRLTPFERVVNTDIPFEGYRLTLDRRTTRLEASSEEGFFYGLQTIRQLLDVAQVEGRQTLPSMRIEDRPRFSYRGLHFDIGRNFYGVEKLKQIADWMAYFKLNKLHLNLTEDEGWRIEIPKLPELTQIGARRGFTKNESEHLHPSYGSGADPDRGLENAGRNALGGGNGFLRTEEFIELLRYASERNIEVIPEFNSPGHARAAVVSMRARAERYLAQGDTVAANEYRLDDPKDTSRYVSAQGYNDNVINVCRPGAIRFFETVIDALADMYEQAGIKLNTYHLGGDELPYGIWKGSPICQELMESRPTIQSSDDLLNLYIGQVLDVLDVHGIRLSAWEDILLVHSEGSHNEMRIQPRFGRTDILPYVWNAAWGWGREDMIYRFANAGYDVVMSNSSAYYFDMADDRDPESIGLHWSGVVDHRTMWETEPTDIFLNPRWNGWAYRSETQRDSLLKTRVRLAQDAEGRFMGIQAQMWTETIRNEEILDEMMFPNLPIFAERAWGGEPEWVSLARQQAPEATTGAKRAEEWNQVANTIAQRTYPIMSYRFGGVDPLLPKPGAVVMDGKLIVRSMFPGLEVRYRLDGGVPDAYSPVYSIPVSVAPGSRIVLRSFDVKGRGGRSTEILLVE